MGSSASKAARTAAGAGGRKYPSAASSAARAPAPSTNAPSRPPPAGQPAQPGPTVHPQARASATRDEAIDLDAQDPDFARSLRSMGVAQPQMLSHTSTYNDPRPGYEQSAPESQFPPSAQRSGAFPDPENNPAVKVLRAREAIQEEANREFIEAGRRGHPGRRFLDVVSLRQVLMLRDEKGVEPAQIEKQLGLRKGVVEQLGKKGVVGLT